MMGIAHFFHLLYLAHFLDYYGSKVLSNKSINIFLFVKSTLSVFHYFTLFTHNIITHCNACHRLQPTSEAMGRENDHRESEFVLFRVCLRKETTTAKKKRFRNCQKDANI